ncbi:MAG: dimethylarginine dimethylaminohydrolase family protein [Planctomycetota bacterium]|jgi:dimethylargininase
MRIAITREISPDIAACELTHRPRAPIDLERARRQHADYEALLTSLGWTVVRLPPLPGFPDAHFVEDVAVVLDALIVLTRPGAASRRGEVGAIRPLLERFGTVVEIEAPATLDGGDVIRAGRHLWVGLTGRTNDEGVAQLRAIAGPLGFTVTTVRPRGCLHLKSAATAVGDETLLVSPAHVDTAELLGPRLLEVDPDEPDAANVLRVAPGSVAVALSAPRTAARLERHGVRCHALDISEVAKAEGALTCCSLLLDGE